MSYNNLHPDSLLAYFLLIKKYAGREGSQKRKEVKMRYINRENAPQKGIIDFLCGCFLTRCDQRAPRDSEQK